VAIYFESLINISIIVFLLIFSLWYWKLKLQSIHFLHTSLSRKTRSICILFSSFSIQRKRKHLEELISVGMVLLINFLFRCAKQVNCEACKMLVNTAISWADAGDPPSLMADKFTALCECVSRGAVEMRAVKRTILFTTDKSRGQFFVMDFGAVDLHATERTTDEFCGFKKHWDCWIGGEQYEWTLDFEWLGPKPTSDKPRLPQVKIMDIWLKMALALHDASSPLCQFKCGRQ
jgi:hypothetical protein